MARLPFIVLDQNALTRDEVLQPAIKEARRLNLRLMLTDSALIELVEAVDWEQRMRRGFAKLSSVPSLVTIAVPIPDLYRIELSTGQPAFDQLEALDYCLPVRQLLEQSQRGEGEVLEFVRTKISGAKARVLPQYLEGNKKMVQSYVEAFRRLLPNDERRRLADPAYRHTALASASWTNLIRHIISNLGFNGADNFARRPSIIVHDILSTVLVAAKWYRDNGLDGAHEHKVTNDLIDAGHAVTASFCHGFATQDRNARTIWEDLVAIAKLRAQGQADDEPRP